jgi:hypothetical protein
MDQASPRHAPSHPDRRPGLFLPPRQDFVGRAETLEELYGLLVGEQGGSALLYSEPGCGKSTLALKFACRKAEDGPIDAKYPLKESCSASYLQRTEWNVRDSDATVVFSIAPTLTGGSKKTVEFTRKSNKPCVHIHTAMPAAPRKG